MPTVMELGEIAKVGTGMQGEATPSHLTTTLYDLITALQAVMPPDDDALVVTTVVHLLRCRWLTWEGRARARQYSWRREDGRAMPRGAPRAANERG